MMNNMLKFMLKRLKSVQERSKEDEDTLPKEYVEKSIDVELLILDDTISEPITPEKLHRNRMSQVHYLGKRVQLLW